MIAQSAEPKVKAERSVVS